MSNKKLKKNKIVNNKKLEQHSERFVQYYGMPIPSLLEKYLRISTYRSILDCGCGDGILLDALKRNGYLKKKYVSAVDMSKKRLINIKKLDKSIHARVDSAEDLRTVRNNSIDFFISTQVIEHVDDKKMLNTVYRVLRKNGIAYITTVFKKWYGWYFYRRNGKWVMDPTHLREYLKDEELLRLVDKRKFAIIEMQKHMIWFPLMDFILRKLYINDSKFFLNNIFFRQIRKISIPMLGYHDWQIILKKIN